MPSAPFACSISRKVPGLPIVLIMLPSVRLFFLLLLLSQSRILCAVIFATSAQVEAELARTDQTSENNRIELKLLPRLRQGRAHRTNIHSSLHNRGDNIHLLNDGWVMRFLRIDSGLPIFIASALLEDFYERVLERVHEFATKISPLKVVSLFVLDLYLDFECDSAEVSWDFIKAFVRAMLDATKRGFTGKFEAIVLHDPTQTVVNVALRILGPADRIDST